MFICPYESTYEKPYPCIMRGSDPYIRVLHASPDAPPVDIYANEKLIARALSYRGFTPYISVPAGNYDIKVYPAGKTTNPVLQTSIRLPDNSIHTLAAIDRLANLSLLPVAEPILPIPHGKVMVRFAHLSPDAPAVDVTLPNGTILFKNVKYKDVTNYIPINPGTHTIEARLAGTEQVALYVPNIRLLPNRFYTIYAIGLIGEAPHLQVLIPLDGNSYLKV